MHYTVKYETGTEEGRAKALLDAVTWLSGEQLRILRENAARCSRKQFRFYCEFTGLTGFPVEVLADNLGVVGEDEE
jgi:hypothetical protein